MHVVLFVEYKVTHAQYLPLSVSMYKGNDRQTSTRKMGVTYLSICDVGTNADLLLDTSSQRIIFPFTVYL